MRFSPCFEPNSRRLINPKVPTKGGQWLDPTVNVLYAFSATLGNGVGLIFPPSNVVFAGIGVLLQAVKDIRSSQAALVDLFGRLEYFFKRLEKYIEVRPTAAMTDIIVTIMVEVLSILGIVTKEVGQGRTKAYLKKLVGRKDVEGALQRLDALTQEEARMAAAEALTITRGIDDKVKDMHERVKGVDERVHAVDIKVDGIDDKVRTVDSKVQGVDHKFGSVIQCVKETREAIQQVGNQVTDLNRSSSSDLIAGNHENLTSLTGNELRKDLRRWVAPPDPSVNFNTVEVLSVHARVTSASGMACVSCAAVIRDNPLDL
ncbi:hypothetical protein EDB83DRAFT_2531008 [Lactarius deliciosus]|nr:hypothetical protein EDB83DRAFT_2531008 [Lactarius deliciosus]